jgi:hypothetical protein
MLCLSIGLIFSLGCGAATDDGDDLDPAGGSAAGAEACVSVASEGSCN